MDAHYAKGLAVTLGTFTLIIGVGCWIMDEWDRPSKNTPKPAKKEHWQIHSKSGNTYSGKLISDGWTEVVLEVHGSQVTIKKSEIESVKIDTER